MVAKVRAVAEIVRADTNVAFVLASAGRRLRRQQQGRLQMTLKPRGNRPHVDQIMRDLTRATSRVPGVQVFFRNPPPINIGGRRGNSSYQISLQGSDIAQLYTAGRQLEQRMRELARDRGHLQRPAGRQPAGRRRDRSRARVRAGRDRHADRAGPLQLLRLAPDLHDLHPDQPVLGHHGAQARVPARPDGAEPAVRAFADGQPDPARIGREVHQGRRAAVHPAQRAAAGRHDLVQPAPRRRARHGRRRGDSARRATRCPATSPASSPATRRRSRRRRADCSRCSSSRSS